MKILRLGVFLTFMNTVFRVRSGIDELDMGFRLRGIWGTLTTVFLGEQDSLVRSFACSFSLSHPLFLLLLILFLHPDTTNTILN